jgi:hypothetical protein
MNERTALVLPTAFSDLPRAVTWTGERLLDVLYREIGTDCVDSSPDLETPYGRMRMWVADDGLLQAEIDHNDRAIAICRAVGYNVPDVGGIAVFTGGTGRMGETLGLPDQLRDRISGICADNRHIGGAA